MASIPAGQQASFRSDAVKLVILWTDADFHVAGDFGPIPYPGPSMADTINALNALDIKVAGVRAGGYHPALVDLSAVVSGTGTVAPAGGVDCDDNGTVDVPAGDPMVCQISTSGSGIAEAIEALVAAATMTADVSLAPLSDPLGQFVGATPAVYPAVDLTVANSLTFTETFACLEGSENTTTTVTMGLMANGSVLAEQHVTITCLPAVIDVEIDVKPGSDPSSLGCKSKGDIPVALLSSEEFDATLVDVNSVLYGKTGTETAEVHRDKDGNARTHMSDVNGDGYLDLVFHFDFPATGFSCADIPEGSSSVELDSFLTGTINDGTPILGTDLIRLTGGK